MKDIVEDHLVQLTHSSYPPVQAFIYIYVVLQVDLYPAAVTLVVESDLLTILKGDVIFKEGLHS